MFFAPFAEQARATNLLSNASFELAVDYWVTDSAVDVQVNRPSAEGTNYVGLIGNLRQDVATEPSVTYYLRFSTRQSTLLPTVNFGGAAVTLSPAPTNPPAFAWYFVDAYVTAVSNVTRLEFVNRVSGGSTALDDLRLLDTREPVQILTGPQGRSAIEGGTVVFAVRAEGGPPIRYVWRFNETPIPGATNATLLLVNVSNANAGDYSVVISNTVSSVTNTAVSLTVEPPPLEPIIVGQPVGETFPAGYSLTLGVVAIGVQPLRYQWLFNGTDILNATNRALTFSSVQSSNAGTYTVRVQNDHGSAVSLPANLVVTNTAGGGLVAFDNSFGLKLFYDVDGTTKLSGPTFRAQLYAGPAADVLRAVGTPSPFRTGLGAGFFVKTNLALPDVPAGGTAYVQTRVWDATAGVSYEDARASSGRFAFSPIFSIVPAGPIDPVPNVPMVSLNLQAGLPLFSTGKLEISEEAGEPQWKLIGAAGFRYLIEKRSPPADWNPLLVVTNTTGTVIFTDTNAAASVNFYRSRILD